MCDQSTPFVDEPATDPALRRTLAAAGLPATGRFLPQAGWVSRVWVGDEYVVRLNNNGQFRDAFRHEAKVVNLLAGSEVPHARIVAHGDGPDGPWYISERLPGRTLYDAWPAANSHTRQSIIQSLGAALRALHRIPVPADLLPPWLADALSGKPWPAFHPPVVSAALQQVEAARRLPGHDSSLLADVADWIQQRLALFTADEPVLVHGDLHGSNVIVDQGRPTWLQLVGVAFGDLYGPDWSSLAQLIAQLNSGTPAADLTAAFAPHTNRDTTADGLGHFPLTTLCEDWSLPVRDYQQLRQYYAETTAIAPHMRVGANDWGATFFCLDNGDPVNDPQHRLQVRTDVPLLVLNAVHDPVTPYVAAVDDAVQLGEHGRLVTYLGWGHGAYPHSACTIATIDSYLIDRTLPKPGATCAAVPPPDNQHDPVHP